MTASERHAEAVDGSISPRVSRLIRRQRAFLIVVGIFAVLAVAGLVAALFIKSPAQRAAEVAPPTASVLTATVTKGVLKQSVVVRATVGSSADLAVTGVLGRSGPAVLTKLPVAAGSQVTDGQVLAEIAGEPVFAFQGAIPAYRDITVGVTGPDSAQLQEALHRLGYLASVRSDQTFDWRAALALRAFLKDNGYAATLDGSGYAMLSLSQVVFMPTLPAAVTSVNAGVGADLAGASKPLLTLTTGALRATATVPEGSQHGLAAGQSVEIVDDVRGRSVTGKVASLGAFDQGSATSSSPPGYPMVVIPDTPFAADWLGQNVRLTIVAAASNAEVLIVPVTAIATNASGDTTVSVLGPNETRTVVPVTVGIISSGTAEVTPKGASQLHEGDHVVVG